MRFPWTISAIIAILLLASCEQQKTYEPMNKEHNRSGKQITITVYEYDSYADVNKALAEFAKENNQEKSGDVSLGWAAWDRLEPYQCEIHIKPPDKIDDDDTLTLGHEMSHCLYGSYHR
jgi:hypothetical protein